MDIQTPNSAPSGSGRSFATVWIVVGVIVIIGGVVLWLNFKGPDPDSMPTPVVNSPELPKTAEEMAVREATVIETSRNAIRTQDADKCSKLLTPDEQDTCRAYVITSEAQGSLDANLCNQITSDYWKANCKDQVTTYKAIAAKNPSLCSGMIEKDRIDTCRKALGL